MVFFLMAHYKIGGSEILSIEEIEKLPVVYPSSKTIRDQDKDHKRFKDAGYSFSHSFESTYYHKGISAIWNSIN